MQNFDKDGVKCVFVRHGESKHNQVLHENEILTDEHHKKMASMSNSNLTDKGKAQAQETAKHLYQKSKKMGYKKFVVWISPFARTVETAAPFVDLINSDDEVTKEIKYVTELYEHTDIDKIIDPELSDIGIKHDLTQEDFIKRVIDFNEIFKAKLETLDNQTLVIIFGHSHFLSILLTYLNTHNEFKDIKQSSLALPNCSISTLRYKAKKSELWTIYHISSISHLPDELKTGHHTLF